MFTYIRGAFGTRLLAPELSDVHKPALAENGTRATGLKEHRKTGAQCTVEDELQRPISSVATTTRTAAECSLHGHSRLELDPWRRLQGVALPGQVLDPEAGEDHAAG